MEGDQKARGYELSKGQYVEIENEDLEAAQIESNHTIEIDSFVPKEEIDKRYYDHPYYSAPDGPAGVDAFAVIRDAMRHRRRSTRRGTARKTDRSGARRRKAG